jgi:hypothetical protein
MSEGRENAIAGLMALAATAIVLGVVTFFGRRFSERTQASGAGLNDDDGDCSFTSDEDYWAEQEEKRRERDEQDERDRAEDEALRRAFGHD